MLSVDVTGTLAKAITPSKGIPEQEFTGLATAVRRYVQDFLRERQEGEHTWSMLPYDRDALQDVKDLVLRLRAERIRTVVWIGIGGSGLGPRVIQEVFEGPQTLEFLMLDTLDPSILEMLSHTIDWKHALVVVASKSGDTLEPMSLFFHCFEALKAAHGDRTNRRVVAITDPQRGALRSFCMEHGIPMLPIHPNVGGRFSIFTPIGTLPMALLDGDIDQFLRGAKEMDTLCQATSIEENPAALLASTQFLLDTKRGIPLRIIMPYSQRLESLGRWNQQLIAESLGKNELTNPIPIAAIGTQDQHSLLQQWMAGPRKAWHLFIVAHEKPRVTVPTELPQAFASIAGKTFGQLLDACYEGTSRALTSAKRPHATIVLPRLDAYHLGQLFFLLLTEVVLLGKLYRIDPYGQPAVEVGKTLTKEILGKGRIE